jgi:hypothetical protein
MSINDKMSEVHKYTIRTHNVNWCAKPTLVRSCIFEFH